MDGVEDENPIVLGELEELAIAAREAAERRGGGIDQRAEGAGEEGFAAGGGAAEDEDGVRAGGTEGGGQPEEDARARALGEVEKLDKGLQWIGVGDWGLGVGGEVGIGEREHAWGVGEGVVQGIGEGPTLGGNFEDCAGGVCEVEEDFGWSEGVAFEADAGVDLVDGRVAVLGAGFEGAESGAEGEGGGCGFEFGIVIGGEPIAEIGGAEGEDAAGIDAGGDGGAGQAAWGKERRGGAGMVEQGERLIGSGETLGHASWFEGSAREREVRGRVSGKWLSGWGKICMKTCDPTSEEAEALRV